jgi:TRAP-type C4-dicarboxylate transport system permease small subunit
MYIISMSVSKTVDEARRVESLYYSIAFFGLGLIYLSIYAASSVWSPEHVLLTTFWGGTVLMAGPLIFVLVGPPVLFAIIRNRKSFSRLGIRPFDKK